MQLTPAYEELCQLCDTRGWRLTLGHHRHPERPDTFYLRVDDGVTTIHVEATGCIPVVLGVLTTDAMQPVRDRSWL